MIKITLKDGTLIEADTPAEAVALLGGQHQVHPTFELNGKYNGACKICGKALPKGGRRYKLCGSVVCDKEYTRRVAREYGRRPDVIAKRKEYQRKWLAKKAEEVRIKKDDIPF